MSYRTRCDGRRSEQARKRRREDHRREIVLARFFDITESKLCGRIAPAYLFSKLWRDTFAPDQAPGLFCEIEFEGDK